MLEIYKKIPEGSSPKFLMPLSLRLIKESAENNIDWRSLHLVDLFSIIYAIRIDKAQAYLRQKQQERWAKKGISEVKKATQEDFDSL